MSRTSRTTRSQSCLYVFIFALLLVKPAEAGQTDGPQVKLTAVKPTALFARDKGGLLQVVEVTVENGSKPQEMSLMVEAGSFTRLVTLGVERNLRYTAHIQVPEVKQPTSARFVLKAGDRVLDTRSVDLRPRKHWTIYFVPITHHDLGYTDTIENVLNLYARFYDDVVRFCDETKDWPEEAQYRYTLEGTWSLQHFVAHRSKEAVDKFGGYVKQGRIEIGALFGNEIDSLCGHEELIRLMYPSFPFQASVRRPNYGGLDHRSARPELGSADGPGGFGRQVLLRGPADLLRVGPQRHPYVLG